LSPGEDGRLGDKTATLRSPGVRRRVGAQSTDECRRQGEDKDDRVPWFDSAHTLESTGMVAWTERLILIMVHTIGHLEHERDWVSSGLARAAFRHGRGTVWGPDTRMITGWVGW
jgi:hypothetical protein